MKIRFAMPKKLYFLMFFCVLFIGNTLIVSCSKEKVSDKQTGEVIDPNDPNAVKLSFSVAGIYDSNDDGGQGNKASARNSSKTNSDSDRIIFTDQVAAADGIEAQLILTEENIKEEVQQPVMMRGKSNSSGKGLKASTSLMDDGIRYRVFIYDQNNNFVTAANATAGSPISIDVYKERVYKWYAYSYNSTSSSIFSESTSTTTRSINPYNSDFLYASGTLTTAVGQNKVNLIFQHKYASISVKLNARGMFSPISFASVNTVTPTNLKYGVFDLKTGKYSSYTNHGLKRIRAWNDHPTSGDTIKTNYLYTVDTLNNIAGIQLKLDTLSLELDYDNQIRTFNNITLNFPATFKPKMGKRYVLSVNLVETPFTINGVQWARNNLYKRAADGGYRFRHVSSNVYGATTSPVASGEYFQWPGGTAATVDTLRDPCHWVYPYGTWRMPTQANMEALRSSSTPQTYYDRSNDPAFFASWRKTTGTNNYGNNWLVFLFIGYMDNNRNFSVSDVTQPDGRTRNRYGAYWTSSTTGNNAYYGWMFKGNANNYNTNGTSSAAGSFYVFDFDKSYYYNIRCVRRILASSSN